MTTFPYMPLYVDRLVADTAHMSAEVFGAYVLLLCAMWRRGGWVPDINSELARLCRVDRRRWAKVRAELNPLLIHRDGMLSQKRLLQVVSDAQIRSSKAALKASSRWHPKTNDFNNVGHAAADAAGMQRARALPKPNISNSSTLKGSGSRSGSIWDQVNERFDAAQPPPKPSKEE